MTMSHGGNVTLSFMYATLVLVYSLYLASNTISSISSMPYIHSSLQSVYSSTEYLWTVFYCYCTEYLSIRQR